MKNSFFPLAVLFSICSANAQIIPRTDPNAANLPVATNLPVAIFSPPSVTIVYQPCPHNQTWMQKNLNVTIYRNGDPIPQVTDPAAWAVLTTGAWCYYNNDPANGKIYGKLYNWYAVNDPRGLAPEGWHIPTQAEWTDLETGLCGASVAGAKMKESGTTHWRFPNALATNSSGFTGLPGGKRYHTGEFVLVGEYGSWWSSTEDDASVAWHRWLYYDSDNIKRFNSDKQFGFSVRCLRD